ncbi:hypothetical protein AAF712_012230 [Marasmius tenuissimus]|uniref:Uncharacterized protein n=1 Tax=Marasmius tenuissimus TaxID=585030 RepID=A0ABR2ZH06_9AGAR
MELRGYLPSVDLEFTSHCVRRFPRAKNALDALRRLGKPPSITPADISEPPPNIQTAIQAMSALSRSRETSVIRASWEPLIGPWVKVLLEDIILGDHQGPLTAEGIATWDHILMYVPGCFLSAAGRPRRPCREDSARSLSRTTTYIGPLFAQTWIKVTDECHRTWSTWSQLHMLLVEVVDATGTGRTSISRADIPRNVVYNLDERTGKIFVRHINFHIPKIPHVSDGELSSVTAFMTLLAGHDTGRNGDENPLGYSAVVGQTIPALIKLVSEVMFKRKIDPKCPPNRIPEHIHRLVVITLHCLYGVLRDPSSAVLALDSGVLKVILKAYPCFFQYDDTRDGRFYKLSFVTTSFLQRISRLVVYPNVLHAFLLAARKVDIEGLDTELQDKSPPTWKCWKEAKDKAALLREIRHELWENGLVICANEDGVRIF